MTLQSSDAKLIWRSWCSRVVLRNGWRILEDQWWKGSRKSIGSSWSNYSPSGRSSIALPYVKVVFYKASQTPCNFSLHSLSRYLNCFDVEHLCLISHLCRLLFSPKPPAWQRNCLEWPISISASAPNHNLRIFRNWPPSLIWPSHRRPSPQLRHPAQCSRRPRWISWVSINV